MKLLHLLFLCLLTTALYFISHNINSSSSSSSPSIFFLAGRRFMKDERMSALGLQNGQEKIKVLNQEKGQTTNQEDSKELEYLRSNDHIDDLAYHIDYHGVTTHPNPTPKHPRP